jgi:hypothetical protein
MKSSNQLCVEADSPRMNAWSAINLKVPSAGIRVRESLHVSPRGAESVGVGRSRALFVAESPTRTAGTPHLPAHSRQA